MQNQDATVPGTHALQEASEHLALAFTAEQPRFDQPRDHHKHDSRALNFRRNDRTV